MPEYIGIFSFSCFKLATFGFKILILINNVNMISNY